MSIKVLLADDTAIMRTAIRRLLEDRSEIELVGEAADFVQTIRLAHKFRPQVVIMDLHMPKSLELTPLDVGSRLHSTAASIVAISIWNDHDTQALAYSFGASALLDKMKLADELIPTVMKLASDRNSARPVTF
jgi:two-component system invasion response regulator UvrY